MKVIVYNDQDNRLNVVHPTSNLSNDDLLDLGRDVVPLGLPFKIMDQSDLPQDRSFRNGWVISNSELTDGVGQ
jgi:hypothetical protein